MITARTDSNNGNYDRHFIVTRIDEETLYQAKAIFDTYKSKGVVLNENFSDDIWKLTNQVKCTHLHFKINELVYLRAAEKWIGCSLSCFVDYVKIYTLFQIGTLGILGLKHLVKSLMKLSELSTAEVSANEKIPVKLHTLEFLKLLPNSNEMRDIVIENMEDYTLFSQHTKGLKLQRVLANFETYFKFNDCLDQFWSRAGEKEKLFYFPLFLWWNLTTILPLRPTEFLLIPRQCLSREKGENILTVRRTKLKGGKNHFHYSIAGDYQLAKYCVPEKLAVEIDWYLRATSQMPVSKLGTLFVQGAHKEIFEDTSHYSYHYFSDSLQRFQKEEMGMDSGSNEFIHLGDTRHIAMISLIVSGGSPTICKELAGHEDINISSHYYANISRFVESATYEFYRKQKAHRVEMRVHRLAGPIKTVAVNYGRCDSEVYVDGGIGDCLRYIGSGGELGDCTSCPHFIDDKTGQYLAFINADEKRKQVDEDCKYLMRVLETVRKGAGCDEDIQSALLKLQCSSTKYSRCLYKNMEDSKYGKTKENDGRADAVRR